MIASRLLLSLVLAQGLLPFAPFPLRATSVRAALVIDTSSEFGKYGLADARELAIDLLRQSPEGSEVSVFTCEGGKEGAIVQTNKLAEIKAALNDLEDVSSATALYDSLEQAIKHLADGSGVSKAVVLISDGRDEKSHTGFDSVIRLAQHHEIPIFTIAAGPDPSPTLESLATSTGGDSMDLTYADGYVLVKRMVEILKSSFPQESVPPPAPPPTVRIPVSVLAVLGFLSAGAIYGWRRLRRNVRVTASPEISLPGSQAEQAPPPGQQAEQRNTAAFLLLQNGAGAGNRYELRRSSFLIGKSPAASLRLGGQAVADEHCRIRFEPPDFLLEDLGNSTGTLVNGRRIRLHHLRDDDIITVAGTSFKFQVELDGPMMG